MTEKTQTVEQLTVLVSRNDIKRIKYLAVDRGVSASEIVRTAVKNFLTADERIERTMQKAHGL